MALYGADLLTVILNTPESAELSFNIRINPALLGLPTETFICSTNVLLILEPLSTTVIFISSFGANTIGFTVVKFIVILLLCSNFANSLTVILARSVELSV